MRRIGIAARWVPAALAACLSAPAPAAAETLSTELSGFEEAPAAFSRGPGEFRGELADGTPASELSYADPVGGALRARIHVDRHAINGRIRSAMAKTFTLAITGAEGTRFTGRCTLTTAAGEETFELSGTVPRREELTGEGLACRIESAGAIAVEIAHDGSVSRSVTSGGTINVATR